MANRGTPRRRRAPAKINLGLHVLRRRQDGYHDIETVLVAINWSDQLTYAPASEWTFTCSDESLPVDEGNVCVRAALRLAEWAGIPAHGALRLEKHLPHGAGLGGGSSDAAATLCLLAQAWRLEVSLPKLHKIAAELGSDVPFFLYQRPMLATARGDRLKVLAPNRNYRLPFAVAVLMPPVQIATAKAYKLMSPTSNPRPDLGELVASNDLARWRQELVNDFEVPILSHYPEVASCRELLLDAGASYAALSGSGSAVFGLFNGLDQARSAAEAGTYRGWRSWSGYPLNEGM